MKGTDNSARSFSTAGRAGGDMPKIITLRSRRAPFPKRCIKQSVVLPLGRWRSEQAARQGRICPSCVGPDPVRPLVHNVPIPADYRHAVDKLSCDDEHGMPLRVRLECFYCGLAPMVMACLTPVVLVAIRVVFFKASVVR